MAVYQDPLDSPDDEDDDDQPTTPGRASHVKMGPKDRVRDVKRREDEHDMMKRFAWAADARGITQAEVAKLLGMDAPRFSQDLGAMARKANVRTHRAAAYQSLLRLTPEYLLAEDPDDVPVERRLEPDKPPGEAGYELGRVLHDHGVVDDESIRDVVHNGLLMHQFRLTPGEVLDLLAIKQERDRREADRRIRESLGRMRRGDE